jgi:hypothetical protein
MYVCMCVCVCVCVCMHMAVNIMSYAFATTEFTSCTLERKLKRDSKETPHIKKTDPINSTFSRECGHGCARLPL